MIGITWALGLLLALSAAANAWLYRANGELIAARAATEQLASDTRAAAEACTRGVQRLRQAGDDRARRIDARMAAIAPELAAAQREALAALSARPARPDDLCGSLAEFWRARIAAERAAERGASDRAGSAAAVPGGSSAAGAAAGVAAPPAIEREQRNSGAAK